MNQPAAAAVALGEDACELHRIYFHENKKTGHAIATCTCGWKAAGTLLECQLRASTHDLDGEHA